MPPLPASPTCTSTTTTPPSTPAMLSHGSSDARFFMWQKIPTIVIAPKGGGHHSENEWVDLKDMAKFHLVLKEFVGKVAKVK